MLSSFAGTTLFGERHGSAPLSVLALHGWGRTHTDFNRVLAPEGEPALDAVALDLPGFGASPGPDRAYSSMDFARAVAPVLDEASSPVVLVGHSHGGRVAVCLAALRPESVKAIVLIGAPVLLRAHRSTPTLAYRTMRRLRHFGLVSEGRIEAYRRRHGSADYRSAEGVVRDTLVTVVNESFENELRGLRCPVVLLWGHDDLDVPVEVAERARDLIGIDLEPASRPRVTLRVLDGVGHLVPTVAPAEVTRAIREAAQ